MNLGTLTLDIIARIGGYKAGLGTAEREAQKRAKAIEKAFDSAAVGVGVAFGLMTTAAVAAFAAINKGLEQAAQFQDIAEKTGASAEGFAAMAVSAKVGGVSMDELANASIKLTKNLTGVDDESKAAGAALTALGIPIEAFKKLAPEEQFKAFAVALDGFRDGAGKTAVAVAAFGKSGAELLPVFKELAQADGLRKILSAEQIAQADAYLDSQTKLRAELSLYASAIATQFVGPMNEVIRITIDVVKELGGFNRSLGEVAANNGIKTFAENAAVYLVTFIEAIGNAVAAIGTLVRGAQLLGTNLRLAAEGASFVVSGGLVGTEGIKNAYKNNIDAYEKLSESFKGVIDRSKVSEGKKLRELFDQQARVASDPETQRLLARAKTARDAQMKDLNFGGAIKPPKAGGGRKAAGGGAADDDTKNLLANELKALEDTIAKERDLMASRNKFLDLYNSQGLISVKDYYDQRQTILDDAVASQSAAYDAEIAALQNYLAKAPKATDRASTQGKINEVLEKQAKLHRDAGQAGIEAGIKREEAEESVSKAVKEVNARLLEMNGQLGAAAAIRFDAANESLSKLFDANKQTAAAEQLRTLRALEISQANINKATKEFSLAQGDLQIAEERITIARERGTMGEMESLRASGEARQRAVVLMEKHLAALLAINEAARSPEQTQAIERLKVQLEGLKATIDPLADKFNTMFSDAAGNAFGDFLTGAKSAKEAFEDFSKTVINEISRMVAKDLAKSLFATAGDSGFNIGSMLSSLFGGTTASTTGGAVGGAGASAAAAGTAALATSATTATAAIAALAAAATAAAASMGASSVGGLISGAGGSSDVLGAFLALNGYAGGGFTGMGAANDPAGIVHRGEYVLDQQTTKRLGVASLNRLNNGGNVGGGFTQNVNVTVGGTPTRKTPTHIAQEVRRQTVTAAARF